MIYTWPVDYTCLPEIDADDAPEDVARLQAAVDTAVHVLWALTGRQFAVADCLARPCPGYLDSQDYLDALPGIGMVPLLVDGAWRNISGCGAGCTPDGLGVVLLPGPVTSISAVEVEGVTIDPSSYRLERDYLYRVDGHEWPLQDMARPLGEPGTWGVKFRRGVEPPAGAAVAVGQLAKEFWNICKGGTCRLPRRWQTITRQGISIQRADPTDILSQGYTGLPEVDTWVRALNPNKLMQPSTILTPDYSSAL